MSSGRGTSMVPPDSAPHQIITSARCFGEPICNRAVFNFVDQRRAPPPQPPPRHYASLLMYRLVAPHLAVFFTLSNFLNIHESTHPGIRKALRGGIDPMIA